ncbi:MAG TPA: hypothetical protein VH637_23995 [Streptosporangiaceae bacterium]
MCWRKRTGGQVIFSGYLSWRADCPQRARIRRRRGRPGLRCPDRRRAARRAGRAGGHG